MVLNPCNCSVTCSVTIVKLIIAKQMGEDSIVGKAPISGLDRTLYVDLQQSCSKYLQEAAEDCLIVFLEIGVHRQNPTVSKGTSSCGLA